MHSQKANDPTAKTERSSFKLNPQSSPHLSGEVLKIIQCQRAADQRQNDGECVSAPSTSGHITIRGIASGCRFARRSRPIGHNREQT